MLDGINIAHITARIGKTEMIEYGTEENPTGHQVNIRAKTSRSYRKGEEWVRIETWHKISIVAQHLVLSVSKFDPLPGDIITAVGHIEYEEWVDKDGVKHRDAKIVVNAKGCVEIERSEKNALARGGRPSG